MSPFIFLSLSFQVGAEMERAHLQRAVDAYFNWLLLCTAMVGLGVLFEAVELLNLGKYRINLEAGLPQIAWWKMRLGHKIERIGLVLVLLGVAGEGVFEFLGSEAEGTLRKFNKIVIATLYEESARAQSEAESAKASLKVYDKQISDDQARIKTAEATVASANATVRDAAAKVASADARIAEAQSEAVEAKKETARFNEIAERERLARVKIEDQLGGWKLNVDDQKRLVDKLKPFSGTVFDLYVDPSEVSFMETLNDVLIGARWVRHDPKSFVPWVSMLVDNKAALVFVRGVQVEVLQGHLDAVKDALRALGDGLIEAGIPVKGTAATEDPQKNQDAIHIIIGRRE